MMGGGEKMVKSFSGFQSIVILAGGLALTVAGSIMSPIVPIGNVAYGFSDNIGIRWFWWMWSPCMMYAALLFARVFKHEWEWPQSVAILGMILSLRVLVLYYMTLRLSPTSDGILDLDAYHGIVYQAKLYWHLFIGDVAPSEVLLWLSFGVLVVSGTWLLMRPVVRISGIELLVFIIMNSVMQQIATVVSNPAQLGLFIPIIIGISTAIWYRWRGGSYTTTK